MAEAEFQRPIDKVHMALVMGGSAGFTIGELSVATNYPAGEVLALIHRLRSEGVRVNAVEDGISRAVPRYIDREDPVTSATVYTVDSSRA